MSNTKKATFLTDNPLLWDHSTFVELLIGNARVVIPHQDDDEHIVISGFIEQTEEKCLCGDTLLKVLITEVENPWGVIDPEEHIVTNIKNALRDKRLCPTCQKGDIVNESGCLCAAAMHLLLLELRATLEEEKFWGYFQEPPELFEAPNDYRCPKCGCPRLYDLSQQQPDPEENFRCAECEFTGDFDEFELPDTEHIPQWAGPVILEVKRCPSCGASELWHEDIQMSFCVQCGYFCHWDELQSAWIQCFCPECHSQKLVKAYGKARCLDCHWSGETSLATMVDLDQSLSA